MLKYNDGIGLHGRIHLELRDPNGILIREVFFDNLITTAGLNLLRDGLQGEDAELKFLAVGRGKEFTVTDLVNNVCTLTGHGLADNTAVKVYTSTTLPGGLAANTVYYAKSLSSSTFSLHMASPVGPGNIVDITDAGTGTHAVFKTPVAGATGLYNETFRKLVTDFSEDSDGVLTTRCYISPSEAIGVISDLAFFGGYLGDRDAGLRRHV